MNIKKYWHELTYYKKGILISIILLVVGWILLILIISLNYNGNCAIPKAKCSFVEYLIDSLYLFSLRTFFGLWWMTLLILLIPPLIGNIIDKNETKQKSKN
jgi:hypothetical protein